MAKSLQAQGQTVYNLASGEPDMEPVAAIREAAAQAAMAGHSKYTQVSGTLALRQAVTRALLRDQGLAYQPDQIVISSGAKHALFNAFQCLLNPGDEAILPAPYWVSYPEQIKLAGGRAVIVPAAVEQAYKLTPRSLQQALSPHSRLLVLNSPNNPTGAVYSEEELRALVGLALEHKLTIISDEVYQQVLYPPARHVSPASLSAAAFQSTVVISGVSKSYAMTGWRIGYLASPDRALIQAATALQSQTSGNPTAVAQRAAEVAWDLPAEATRHQLAAFTSRRQRVLAAFDGVAGVAMVPPAGAFYGFLSISGCLRRWHEQSADAFCERLLTEQGVAVVPGSAFGAPDAIRFSFAVADEVLTAALTRLVEALGR